ncbi:MAG: hypothetical protein PUJ06_04850 [Stecheria intestinalis]|nr:hypothetical protein [Anaerolactibacter massiliensis]MDD7679808.1 hypothetical protein [Stecheria intestinalis]
MDDHLLEKIETGFVNGDSLAGLVVIIEPYHFIGFFVIGDNTAFCHCRP